ncbi:DUF805 domain-containing protein [Kaistia defluvii]|uniref:Uncharacterized membrane protein YhaH (DUF805 family) n=1 Tax=Kaistia defluvii TaxID=410841 RepID=A0ABV2R591_9HYPH
MSLWQLLFSFQGRIARTKFLISIILVNVLLAALELALHKIFSVEIDDSLFWLTVSMINAMFAAFIWAALGVKRLHDRNKSGWWILAIQVVPSLILYPAIEVAQMGGPLATIGTIVATISIVVLLWSWIELVHLRGTRGENRFGPDPLAPTSSTPVSAEPGLA